VTDCIASDLLLFLFRFVCGKRTVRYNKLTACCSLVWTSVCLSVSYSPAKVRRFDDDDDYVLAEFYDGVKANVALSEVFPIPREKYEADKRYILRKEAELVGQVVVAWNEAQHQFDLGMYWLTFHD